MGYVYVIRMQGTDYVKIGKADNVANRLMSIQTGNPYLLEIEHIKETDDPSDLESRLFHALKANRVRGEWFIVDKDYIKTIFREQVEKHHTERPLRDRTRLENFLVEIYNGKTIAIKADRKEIVGGMLKLYVNGCDRPVRVFKKHIWVSVK